MKRIAVLVALMALSSPACARGAYSFTFHGHRVHIAAHCRSLSCVSVSGINGRSSRDNDIATTNEPAPTPAPAPVQAPAQVPAPPPPAPQAQPAPIQPPAAPAGPALVTAQLQPAPVVTRVQTIPPAVQTRTAPATAPTLAATSNRPAEIMSSPPPAPAPAVGFDTSPPQPAARASQDSESPAVDTPLGDWRTDGKKGDLVRIEACGTALCGYALDPSTGAKGESVLVNMKPKNDGRNDTKWIGSVYSRSSGNNYYGTMTLKRKDDKLRVEACALGRFLCSGNTWTRVTGRADEVVNAQAAPRS